MTRTRALILVPLLWLLAAAPAFAQSSPGWTFGYVPTVEQWNAIFASKQDYLGAPPLLTTGGTMTGPLVAAGSISGTAGLNIQPGTAPSSPINGDLWETTSGIFAQINGTTYNLLTPTTPCPVCAVTNATNTFSQFQIINQNAGSAATPQTGVLLQLQQANSLTGRVEVDTYAGATILSGVRADGTLASPSGLVANDEILSLNAWGVDSSLARVGPAAAVRLYAGGTWTSSSRPTYIDFSNVAAGSTTLTSRAHVESDGGFTLNGAASLGAGMLSGVNTQNNSSKWLLTNASTGASAAAQFEAANSTGTADFGVGGTGLSNAALTNRAFVFSSGSLSGISLYSTGTNPIDFYINNSRVGGFTSGGDFSLAHALGVPNGGTGATSFTANLPLLGNGTSALAQGTLSGNTTKLVTTSGTLTDNDCLKSVSGNAVDSGAQCGAGNNISDNQQFIAGTGFTPGGTTTLTLHSTPTNAGELLIFFDSNYQAITTSWTLSGAVVTFAQAIPVWVNTVSMQWFTATTTAGVGSITDPAGNVLSGAGLVASPLAVTSNTIYNPACFVQSRADALLRNLSTCNVVTTGGYGTGGDGGFATFKPAGATAFTDTSIATGNITNAGTGCTGGPTFFGVQLSGGTGSLAEATVVLSGTNVSTVTLTGSSPGYSVGDVLTGSVTGCTFTWTVATITAPTGSFTDLFGHRFQILIPAVGIDMRAFGVKFDFTQGGGDAGATDNFTNITNVYTFAAAQSGGIFARGGVQGGRVLIPRGTAMYCGSNGAKPLTQPYAVSVKGQGNFASALKPCDAWSTSTNMYELCNSQSHQACFQTMFEDAQIYVSNNQDVGANVSTLAAVYSNNCQQENCGLRNAVIFSGACRQAYKLEIGYGGSSLVAAADDVELIGGQVAANCQGRDAPLMSINYGTTQVTVGKLTLSGLSTPFGGYRTSGLSITGGFVDTHAVTAENVVNPMTVNIPGGLANGMVTLRGFEGDQGCTWFATIPNGNTPGNFSVTGPMAVNSCSGGLVQNGQPAGVNMTVPQVLPKNFP